jgi:transposase
MGNESLCEMSNVNGVTVAHSVIQKIYQEYNVPTLQHSYIYLDLWREDIQTDHIKDGIQE